MPGNPRMLTVGRYPTNVDGMTKLKKIRNGIGITPAENDEA